MHVMKQVGLLAILILVAISCHTSKTSLDAQTESALETASDTVKIANDQVEYEIIIIEPGFNAWVNSVAQPRGYYGQKFLESRNRVLVMEWNARARQPMLYNPDLYQMEIDYDPKIDYGYEVNYLLYNYLVYFQLKYKQRLSNFVPRI